MGHALRCIGSRHPPWIASSAMRHSPMRVACSFAVAVVTASAIVLRDPAAHAQACSLGSSCSFDVTSSVDIPGFGNVTQTTPVSVDLTDLKADGSGSVGVATPDVSTTTDTRTKETKISKKGNGKKTKQTIKRDKSTKDIKVKIDKSKDRRGS